MLIFFPREKRGIFFGFLFLFLSFLFWQSSPAWAVLRVDVNGGATGPMLLSISSVHTQSHSAAVIGRNIQKVMENDLIRSGLFRFLNSSQTPDKITNLDQRPNFALWHKLNVRGVLVFFIEHGTGKEKNLINISIRIWDIYGRKQIVGLSLSTREKNWRRISHVVADRIYEKLTGERGYFDTHVVFVSNTGSRLNRTQQLAIMDQDGANERILTKPGQIIEGPVFSSNEQRVAYLSYDAKARRDPLTGELAASSIPHVYILDLKTGKQRMLGTFSNMTFAPRFSPDDTRVVMSIEDKDGNSSIYSVDLDTHVAARLTNTGGAIDTSPCYSPDGKKIVFDSDRSGSQQLYVMNSNGTNVQRITFGGGRYATPVWSPRGDFIAFIKMENRQFSIGVMRPDGSGERILTTGFYNAGPTWAPNGRVIMYYKDTKDPKGGPHLWSVDMTGYGEHEVPTSTYASSPAWSPELERSLP